MNDNHHVLHLLSRAGLHDNVPADLLPRWHKLSASLVKLSPDWLTSQIGWQRQRPSRLTAKVADSPPVSCYNSAQTHWLTSQIGWQLLPCSPPFGDSDSFDFFLVPCSPVGTQQVQRPWRRVGLGRCRATRPCTTTDRHVFVLVSTQVTGTEQSVHRVGILKPVCPFVALYNIIIVSSCPNNKALIF